MYIIIIITNRNSSHIILNNNNSLSLSTLQHKAPTLTFS